MDEAAASGSNGLLFEDTNKLTGFALQLLNMASIADENRDGGNTTINSPQNEEHDKCKKNDNEEITCKICDVKVLLTDMKEHRNTLKHIEAQRQKIGELECNICKEKFVKGYWKEHKKTRTHILKQEQSKGIEKAVIRTRFMRHQKTRKEAYEIRPGSEENQQYINTLTAFLALRHALSKRGQEFKISVNNQAWSCFGDIVFEFNNSETQVIQCKKIQTKNNYTDVALSAESGNLSLKEQCEIMKKLEEKEMVIFGLHTVSGVIIDNNSKFTYESKLVKKWHEVKDAKIWKGKEVEIKQSKGYQGRDLFNTTDDSDDVLTFAILNNNDENVNNDLSKFRMYTNQKNRIELKFLIRTMIEDKFNISADISDELVKYVKQYFKTDKAIKKKCNYFKMTREDVLLKIAELLLVPYLVIPDHAIEEKNLNMWNNTLQQFDVIVIKHDNDIVEKIYSSINHILKLETNYTLNIFNNVVVDKKKIDNENLKSKIFEDYGFDSSWQFLYLALWKIGLAPLVLKADNEKNLNFIIDVISFFKTENVPLKFIITTNLQPVHSCFPQDLKVFLNLQDLKILDNAFLTEILRQNIKILDFGISLEQIESCNKDFLEKLTPDALLNMLLEDYSFRDISVPITKEIVDNTLVLDDESVNKLKDYFRERDGEKGLSYLVSVNGLPSFIQVPPEL